MKALKDGSSEIVFAHHVAGEVARPSEVDHTISAETARRIASAIPANTVRAYAGDRAAFRRWCALVGRTPLPATAETAAEYATYLAVGGALQADGSRNGPAAPRTIERALSAIRTEHRENGYGDGPDLLGARRVIKSHRRDRSDRGIRDRQAAVLTVDNLRAMVDACDPDTLAGTRDRALIVLGFSMMVRRSELVALNTLGDITDTHYGLDVLIRWSKTDQDAIGEQVPVHYGSNPRTCPVRLLRAWRRRLAEVRPEEGPLWMPIDKLDRLPHMPGYCGKRGTGRLSGKAVGLILQDAARKAGVSTEKLSAHSLRASGATAAYLAGSDVLVISRRGRWKDGSPVVYRYIREADRGKVDPMAGVL
ncbi:tyrosine-type recombinase/integrase [Cryptosporangium aurantiacum]|uniref:Site-specific recombinase XerD n=1 Tax=Cryptosporangium aurantiacum TaxID=134849 RepID=A0A1M7RB66_9ACTN|nr:tyrosine-type recombinase/integrase [Cryptosporangium aurantiacum]SHN43537.1 Site-specific recombinase XerD [Cryptosporangium aurantiacum]